MGSIPILQDARRLAQNTDHRLPHTFLRDNLLGARSVHTDVSVPRQTQVLQQETSLEVLVGMKYCVKLGGIPQSFVFHLQSDQSTCVPGSSNRNKCTCLLDIILVRTFKNTVASDMIPLLANVFLDLP